MSVSPLIHRLDSQTGCALLLGAGEALEITDIEGEQVADLAIFSQADPGEYFSSGRTLDYNSHIFISTGATLYSNRSSPLMRIEADDVGIHDYLLAPCSGRMFEILRGLSSHRSCHENLVTALSPYGIHADNIDSTFNAFMHVEVTSDGAITLLPPLSQAGDRIVLRAAMELLVGVTACSSEHTNNGRCKPIGYRIVSR
jgi:uncharacterized protein YcgI (DUF1989 family)